MKIYRQEQIEKTSRLVAFREGVSLRYVLEKEGMGFSLHETRLKKGMTGHWHYKHHLEACYCISGYGILTNLKTSEKYHIIPGDCYILDDHDDHTFESINDTILISVFNPPVHGDETHREDGSYELRGNKSKERLFASKIVDFVNNSESNYDAVEAVMNLLNQRK